MPQDCGYLIVLKKDIDTDYREEVISAIKMLKFVVDVVPVPADPQSWIIEDRIKRDIEDKIRQALHPERKANER